MKTILKSSITQTTLLALSIAAFLSLTFTGTAQVAGGRGNLASAPERGAERLINLSRNQKMAPMFTAKYAKNAKQCCPQCKETWVRVTETTFKGGRTTQLGGKTQRLAAQHLCPGCSNVRIAKGHGKNKTINAAHICSQCDVNHTSCSRKPIHSNGTPTAAKG